LPCRQGGCKRKGNPGGGKSDALLRSYQRGLQRKNERNEDEITLAGRGLHPRVQGQGLRKGEKLDIGFRFGKKKRQALLRGADLNENRRARRWRVARRINEEGVLCDRLEDWDTCNKVCMKKTSVNGGSRRWLNGLTIGGTKKATQSKNCLSSINRTTISNCKGKAVFCQIADSSTQKQGRAGHKKNPFSISASGACRILVGEAGWGLRCLYGRRR